MPPYGIMIASIALKKPYGEIRGYVGIVERIDDKAIYLNHYTPMRWDPSGATMRLDLTHLLEVLMVAQRTTVGDLLIVPRSDIGKIVDCTPSPDQMEEVDRIDGMIE